jgi:hypothetical protein
MGEVMCKMMTQEVGSKNEKDRFICGQSTNVGALRSKIRCESNRRRLRETIRMKNPRTLAWQVDSSFSILAPVHDALRVRELLAKKSITKMCQPLSLQQSWHPHTHRNVTLPRGILESDFHDRFRQWQHRLTKCIVSQGEHFEGDSSRYCTG